MANVNVDLPDKLVERMRRHKKEKHRTIVGIIQEAVEKFFQDIDKFERDAEDMARQEANK